MAISGRSALRTSRSTKYPLIMSSRSSLPIAAMIIAWSRERYRFATVPLRTATAS